MKNLFSALGMALVASFSLVSCAEDRLAPVDNASGEGVPFEISTVITKTTNDGLSTKWATGDQINLFHAEAGTTTYVNDKAFTVDSDLAGKFTGELTSALADGKSYDWYANYPYSSYQTTPAGVDKSTGAYVTIGGTTQTQTGNDSKAHLSEKACPLYGVAKGVASDAMPALAMKNLASVVAIKVTNTLDDALTVTSVGFTSTEDIVGTYYIDYSGDAPIYKASGDKYVNSTANLTVSGGTAIAKDGSATFYIAIKPHTVAKDSKLTIAVNDVEKTLTLTKDITFTAGSIKTIGYKMDQSDQVTLPWSIDGTGGSAVWTSTLGLSQSGLGTDYKSANSPYLSKFDTDGDYVQVKYDSPALSVKFGVKMIGGAASSTITVSGSVDGSSFTDIEAFTVSGSQGTMNTFTTSNAISKDYRYVRITFTKRGANVGLGGVSIQKASTDPAIEVENILGVSARGCSEETLEYSITNPIDGTTISATCDGTIVKNVTVTDGVVKYIVSENISGAARDGKITLTYGSVTKEVKVSQVADTFESTVTEILLDATADSKKTFTVTSDFDWIAAITGAEYQVSPASYTWAEGGKQTITVTASADNASESGTIGLGTLTITNSKTEKKLTVDIKQKSSYVSGTTVTKTINEIVSANDYKVSSDTTIRTQKKSIAIDEVITISTTAEGNSGSFWGTDTIDWRCYQSGATDAIIKVVAAEGHVIKKLTLTFNVKNSGILKNGSASITSGTEYDVNAQSVSYTIGCSKSGSSNGQIRITGVSVTYE